MSKNIKRYVLEIKKIKLIISTTSSKTLRKMAFKIKTARTWQ